MKGLFAVALFGFVLLQPSCAQPATRAAVAKSEPRLAEPAPAPGVAESDGDAPSRDAGVSTVATAWADNACRGFEPRGRTAKAPSSHCAGPAKDRVTGERDRAALKKLEERLELGSYYAALDPDREIAIFVGTSAACGTRCTPPVQAKLWMYIGLYYGSGLRRVDDARCAFENALEWDPGVHFDRDLATDAVMGAFAEARAHVCGAGSAGTNTKPNPQPAGER